MTSGVSGLVERQAIADVIAHYCDRLDAHDIEGVAALFTHAARTNYGAGRGGDVVGRDAIFARIARGQSAFRRTHHQLGHSTIEVSGDCATAVSAAFTWHERFSGERELIALRYIDEFVRIDTTWLISYRRVEISIVEGFEGTEWNWWPRNPPLFPEPE